MMSNCEKCNELQEKLDYCLPIILAAIECAELDFEYSPNDGSILILIDALDRARCRITGEPRENSRIFRVVERN